MDEKQGGVADNLKQAAGNPIMRFVEDVAVDLQALVADQKAGRRMLPSTPSENASYTP